jgi:hypothetical protein
MGRSLYFLLAAATLFAVENPWAKVQELKSGTEVRIVRRGSAQAIEAKLDEVREDAVVVVVKNEQKAVPKEEIDRLDYRPKGRAATPEVNSKRTDPDPTPPVGMNHGPNVPGQSYGGGLTFSKPGYETIYRRQTGAPPATEKHAGAAKNVPASSEKDSPAGKK